MLRWLFLASLVACDAISLAPPASSTDGGTAGGGVAVGTTGTSEIVAPTAGALRGVSEGATFSYRGIPYAAPPVGALRWKPPADPPPWSGVRDASEFGQSCPQVDQEHGIVVGQEDCLTLNVWTPQTHEAPLPVLVFLHGGDNFWGSATGRTSDGLYNGAKLAERGPAVVVTLDYRLAALGFLAHPAFAKENPEGTTGNWALLDQLRALDWVKQNIAAFGGDPARVLLFGQSAGSYDACSLVTSPRSIGLFESALMESGPCWIPPRADTDRATDSVLQATGCANDPDPAGCLRAVPAATLAALPVSASDDEGMHKFFYPSVDGYVLVEPPLSALALGHHQHMPLAFGTNAHEMTTLLASVQLGAPLTAATYHAAMVATVGTAHALDVETIYAGDALLSYNRTLLDITGDLFFHCRVRRSLRAAARGQSEPVWRYLYAHTLADGSAAGVPASAFGAGHGLELLVLFDDHLDTSQSIWWRPTDSEQRLSGWMEAAWTKLASSGDTGWERYDGARDNHAVLDDTIGAAEGLKTKECDFWDGIDAP
jgi:para-nitrobenzyl esterase